MRFVRAATVTAARVIGRSSPQIATEIHIETGTNAVPTANAIGVMIARNVVARWTSASTDGASPRANA